MRNDELMITNKKLGIEYSPKETIFRVWSPLRTQIILLIYTDAAAIHRKSYTMIKKDDGVHEATIKEDLKGCFYTFLIDGYIEVTDPYSISSSLNSNRSAIIDLNDTNPEGWEKHTIPYNIRNCDAIIYEVHVKDFTISETSGAKNRGKYLGFVEKDTKFNGVSTGLSHLKELGVSHVHIMPVYDFLSVKEDANLFFNKNNYNWGYDPELYNSPEGSYSNTPQDPASRVRELKTMIMTLHESGIKVILDVVYNHTFRSQDSNFNIIMPNYYYRDKVDGTFSNGSGCGNELASERPMVRKFIIESLLYWVNEYKVDGFRFDLMALIDIDTIEEAITRLREIKPDIFIYGEPWTGGITTLSDTKTTTKGTQGKLSFALFNDDFRNALKGDNDGTSMGFVQGNLDFKQSIETGISGSIYFDDGHIGFASHPRETINYLNSHDNLIFADKIRKTFPSIDEEGFIRLNKFAHSILLTSQGIPFIHAGNEFLRSKKMVHNSYNSDISINEIDWSFKEKYRDYYRYFRELMKLRMQYKAFRMTSVEAIKKRIKFMDFSTPCSLISYTNELQEGEKFLLVIHNPNPHSCMMTTYSIRSHLKHHYGRGYENMEIKGIFNEDGFIDKKYEKDIYGIEIPHFTTSVFEVKP